MVKISKKIKNDKYYTSQELAEYVVNKTKEVIGEENITEYLEPSAGAGVFLDYLNKPYLAYDIEPEDDRVTKQNYLELELEYKQGRCVIGNPPFGNMMKLAEQFYKKSIQIADYIAFILPISQYNNNIKLFDFDFIYSEDLGIREYSDRKIHCCLNIYRKPIGELNKKPNFKLKDIKLKTSHRCEHPPKTKFITKEDFDYDFRICTWGSSIGEFCKFEGEFSTEICIKVLNNKFKNEVYRVLKNVNWTKEYPMVATPKIDQWHIYKYLKEQIPELQ